MQKYSIVADRAAIPAPSVGVITATRARTCGELLAERRPCVGRDSRLLEFTGVDGRDVYNISAPFLFAGKLTIAGRVEHRSTEISETMLFRAEGSQWAPCFRSPLFASLQDPCVSVVKDEIIIGGVRYPVVLPAGETCWQMVFYRLSSEGVLSPLVKGPPGMKDIRLCELADGRVGVFSRPQGSRGGRGKIGFAIANSLDEVTSELINEAPILPNQFASGEWGGANEAHLVADGTLGVLGHVAKWGTDGERHYYAMAFKLDPRTLHATSPGIIARREDFPLAPAKRFDLVDVVFSGGLHRHEDGTATLYAGLSDAAAGCVRLPDPFL